MKKNIIEFMSKWLVSKSIKTENNEAIATSKCPRVEVGEHRDGFYRGIAKNMKSYTVI